MIYAITIFSIIVALIIVRISYAQWHKSRISKAVVELVRAELTGDIASADQARAELKKLGFEEVNVWIE